MFVLHYEGIFTLLTHLKIISIIKPTRCTIFQNLFYFGTTLYMFRKVSPSIIRSLRLYLEHQVYVIQVLWLRSR